MDRRPFGARLTLDQHATFSWDLPNALAPLVDGAGRDAEHTGHLSLAAHRCAGLQDRGAVCFHAENVASLHTACKATLHCPVYSIASMQRMWTTEEEAANLAKRFEGVNQAAFAREFDVPGGASMLSQHIKGRRPINMDAALAYMKGFGVRLEEISPRLAQQMYEALRELDEAKLRHGRGEDDRGRTALGQSSAASPGDTPRHRMRNSRPVWVVGVGQGGRLPERIWSDGDYPVGATDEYAEVSTTDEHAFACRVVGDSMAPRYMPGEYALVEPGTTPELEDDVLVRLNSGETMFKRLLSRRGGIRLGSYNVAHEVMNFRKEEVTWMYYVAHPIPVRKIKQRIDSDTYHGPDRRDHDEEVPEERRSLLDEPPFIRQKRKPPPTIYLTAEKEPAKEKQSGDDQ